MRIEARTATAAPTMRKAKPGAITSARPQAAAKSNRSSARKARTAPAARTADARTAARASSDSSRRASSTSHLRRSAMSWPVRPISSPRPSSGSLGRVAPGLDVDSRISCIGPDPRRQVLHDVVRRLQPEAADGGVPHAAGDLPVTQIDVLHGPAPCRSVSRADRARAVSYGPAHEEPGHGRTGQEEARLAPCEALRVVDDALGTALVESIGETLGAIARLSHPPNRRAVVIGSLGHRPELLTEARQRLGRPLRLRAGPFVDLRLRLADHVRDLGGGLGGQVLRFMRS